MNNAVHLPHGDHDGADDDDDDDEGQIPMPDLDTGLEDDNVHDLPDIPGTRPLHRPPPSVSPLDHCDTPAATDEYPLAAALHHQQQQQFQQQQQQQQQFQQQQQQQQQLQQLQEDASHMHLQHLQQQFQHSQMSPQPPLQPLSQLPPLGDDEVHDGQPLGRDIMPPLQHDQSQPHSLSRSPLPDIPPFHHSDSDPIIPRPRTPHSTAASSYSQPLPPSHSLPQLHHHIPTSAVPQIPPTSAVSQPVSSTSVAAAAAVHAHAHAQAAAAAAAAAAASPYAAWTSPPIPPVDSRPRAASSAGGSLVFFDKAAHVDVPMPAESFPRPQRPSGPVRTPSNTYAPPRRPQQYIPQQTPQQIPQIPPQQPQSKRRDPAAQYRAQEEAYVRRLREGGPTSWFTDKNKVQVEPQMQPLYPNFANFNFDASEEEPTPADSQPDNDQFDSTVQIALENANASPTCEAASDPLNKERFEWHSMLETVLKGDVVRQEKKRIINIMEQKAPEVLRYDLWVGVKAKACGRTAIFQERLIKHGRESIGTLIEEIISFQIKGESEAGKPPLEQARDILAKIEKCESLYPNERHLRQHNQRAASSDFQESCNAVIAWHNTTWLINTQLAILKRWVGNEELDFTKPMKLSSSSGDDLTDEGSFLDRIMKENNLKTLQSSESMLNGISRVIQKAKQTLIEQSAAFVRRHLPPYIEELLTLINFPSRLIQEVIRLRLSYAKKMKDPGQQSTLLLDQMIDQFRMLLKVAVDIKQRYVSVALPDKSWDPPPCVDENFDETVVDALKYYFRLLNWKLSANKNAFKEAEILEVEWGFSNAIGRRLESGDVQVAEQFSTLTAKALQRLMINFEKELQFKEGESPAEMEKRYKQVLDSVRVRQRKLFRFSRILRQDFENATEFNLKEEMVDILSDALYASGHFMVTSNDTSSPKNVILVASPNLWKKPKVIQGILGTSFRSETPFEGRDADHREEIVHLQEDKSHPYVLAIRPDKTFKWVGRKLLIDTIEYPSDVRLGKVRLIADGTQSRLQSARAELANLTNLYLDVATEQRANLSRVNIELNKIKKTASKLSSTIIDSVQVIRQQSCSIENHELIQTFFDFATEFGKRSLMYLDPNRQVLTYNKLIKLALDWVSFICDDCDSSDRRTFKWAVTALENAMVMTYGNSILSLTPEEYAVFREKVAGCMSVLISHFDIMGARSRMAARAKDEANGKGVFRNVDLNLAQPDDDAIRSVQSRRVQALQHIDLARVEEDARRQALGRVLEGANEADRSVTLLSSSAANVTIRWQQGQYLGGGTSGSVFAAIDLDTSFLIAVKEIRLQDAAATPSIVQQICDEMNVLEILNHPNIVSYQGIEVHRDKVYIFMEYCSGGSLAELLEHGRIEDETVIMVYALQMLEGLAYLHEAGVVHRDIKPANILLDQNGVIKYVDFGAAMVIASRNKTLQKKLPGDGRKHPSVTGTPMYMSPELVRGELSPSACRLGAVDIWSLGCVILEMATGNRPWANLDNEWAIMYKIAQGSHPHLPAPDQLSAAGIDFVARCFEIDPMKRPTAVELLQHEWIEDIRSQVVAETPPTPSDSDNGSGGCTSMPSSNQTTPPTHTGPKGFPSGFYP